MIINSRSSNFIFNFPLNFFDAESSIKWLPIIRRAPIPYDTLITYMNAQVQSVTFPSLQSETVSQTRNFGKQQDYKGAKPPQDLFGRDITISMRTLDGHINYWIFLENALRYLEILEENPTYLEDLKIQFLDQEGRIMNTAVFGSIVLTGISETSLSYADNNVDYKSFDVTFKWSTFKFKVERD